MSSRSPSKHERARPQVRPGRTGGWLPRHRWRSRGRRHVVSGSGHLEMRKLTRSEGRPHRDIGRIATSGNQDSPDPRRVVPGVKYVPAVAEIDFEPGAEIHRGVAGRDAHITEIAGAIACRDVHAAAK